MLLAVDRVATRYRLLPHEVLALTPPQLALALLCIDQADATRALMVERIRDSSGGWMPVPTIPLPG